MNTKQLTYPTIEEQEQYWIDKEAQSDKATPETRVVSGNIRMLGMSLEELESVMSTEALPKIPNNEQLTTADPKPKPDDELSRTESLTDWYDHGRNDFDRGDLRDEGRNPDGSGMSYGERNQ